ncbi:GDP-mannose-dependent alpha-(1-6)-phosphatidylinositol monomannoside mannosyltransferase [Gemmata obscuriglobus]|uniref:Glycosyl transferase family 1 n=1 Tax=Gemmata obscuriglobus TaxID=114 RepID=A0A2Z3H430_9BACT|nr:glycosyltransferase [Gemmata obscuriglobus]AWM39611.1 glycosyl transferase family 1 [Gemmata obscuriglobus]QEG27289.1 GDP-mannose-dependent alpha-(1-6)-phosphatidylinositol monomannoside mannosyltransferase [Gemmata obscuriglobus]VTS04093.1 glycosyl transferase family 1 : Glycosyl transferase group 1 OS=Cyanothece sp. (strain PCC 7425 / ATCC 29141) GN=Cyan7425_1086 PE=4 SV=1: Glyco_trans_4_4: Glycos_transf_1 [Gemmata obscuriglobus UQM 2246]
MIHLGKYYPPSPGGIEGHTQSLARAQAALGADVRVVVVNHRARDGHDATFEKWTRTPWAEDADGQVRITRVGRLANVAKLDVAPGLSGLLNDLARNPPDVWHLHAPNITMMLAVLRCRWLAPLVITHHSDIVRQKLLKHFVRPLEVALYRRAARILPTSGSYVDGSDLLQQFANKLTPVPLGMDLSPFQTPSAAARACAERFRERFRGPVWLCVGRLIYYKGLHVALEALKRVPGTLVVIGTGPLGAELNRKAQELGVADRVVWYGHASADELVGAYLASAALWFPSVARSEGFGLVQVEAMAAGCPVINTAVPASGVAWVARHEQESLTVPVSDSAALAAAANRLLTEAGLKDRLVAAARMRAAAEFDWLVMGRRCLAVYGEVAGRV